MRAWGLAVAAALLVGGLGCVGDSGGGGGSTCARAAAKLRGCGLTEDASISDCDEPVGANETCESNCYLNAACADLESVFCAMTLPAGLASCMAACPDDAEFACGVEGETVGQGDRCDGFQDCSNSADEEGCPTFDCASGDESYPESYECDGFDDCADGSDELSCPEPTTFICE